MKLLVTGGAGYIGSNMVRMLVARGYDVVVLDSMEFGHQQAIPEKAKLVVGNIGDTAVVEPLFEAEKFDGVIHFAAYLSVSESVKDPRKYVFNNIIRPVTLLDTMAKFGVKHMIFSSTAAVYGNPVTVPISEDHQKLPESPYGLTKWCFEELLRVYDKSSGIKSISLRYFNASGAALDGANGEAHDPETHIIPMAIRTAQGKQKEFYLFGTDYPTPDGTCVRDFIHIEDLAEAHLVALNALKNGHGTDSYNVATGNGVTNKQIVEVVKKVTGVDFPVIEKERRPGDPHSLVADPTKLKKEFGWEPTYSDLETIVESAWKWHSSHPKGYSD